LIFFISAPISSIVPVKVGLPALLLSELDELSLICGEDNRIILKLSKFLFTMANSFLKFVMIVSM
jgi:hypothetical protein